MFRYSILFHFFSFYHTKTDGHFSFGSFVYIIDNALLKEKKNNKIHIMYFYLHISFPQYATIIFVIED